MIAPNIYLLIGEQDMISITRAGFVCEYEIKTSKEDFKKDFSKSFKLGVDREDRVSRTGRKYSAPAETLKHEILSGKKKLKKHKWKCPKLFWFVVPDGMIEPSEVPDYAGLMYCKIHPKLKCLIIEEVKKPRSNRNAVKAPREVYEQISTSLTFRFFKFWLKSIED